MRYYGRYSNRGRDEREKRKQAVLSHTKVPISIKIIEVSKYRAKKIVGSSIFADTSHYY